MGSESSARVIGVNFIDPIKLRRHQAYRFPDGKIIPQGPDTRPAGT